MKQAFNLVEQNPSPELFNVLLEHKSYSIRFCHYLAADYGALCDKWGVMEFSKIVTSGKCQRFHKEQCFFRKHIHLAQLFQCECHEANKEFATEEWRSKLAQNTIITYLTQVKMMGKK